MGLQPPRESPHHDPGGNQKWEVVAHEATDEERDRLWPMVVDTYADFAVYQARTKRKLPVVVLAPVG